MSDNKKKNRGKEFEQEILDRAKKYEADRRLILRKVDPPTRIIRGKIIMCANPFLDFCGVWAEKNGRAVFLEAKRTDGSKLKLDCAGGLTKKQLQSMRRWKAAGAATGIIWRNKIADNFVTMNEVETTLADGTKHLNAEACRSRIPYMDFLRVMNQCFY